MEEVFYQLFWTGASLVVIGAAGLLLSLMWGMFTLLRDIKKANKIFDKDERSEWDQATDLPVENNPEFGTLLDFEETVFEQGVHFYIFDIEKIPFPNEVFPTHLWITGNHFQIVCVAVSPGSLSITCVLKQRSEVWSSNEAMIGTFTPLTIMAFEYAENL